MASTPRRYSPLLLGEGQERGFVGWFEVCAKTPILAFPLVGGREIETD